MARAGTQESDCTQTKTKTKYLKFIFAVKVFKPRNTDKNLSRLNAYTVLHKLKWLKFYFFYLCM